MIIENHIRKTISTAKHPKTKNENEDESHSPDNIIQ